jgi:predicted GIY-YIG superfamily endonuclease
VYVETFASREEAMSRESAVKHLTRAEKEELILGTSETHI